MVHFEEEETVQIRLSKALTENFCRPKAFILNKDSEQKGHSTEHTQACALLCSVETTKKSLCFPSLQTFNLETKAHISGLNGKNPKASNMSI